MLRFTAVLAGFSFLSLLAGCEGEEQAPQQPDRVCEGPINPGPSPIRRLTRVEYNNTVYQLFGDTSRPANKFPPDEESNGFDNQARTLVVSPLLGEQYMTAAEELAANNAGRLMSDLPACTAATVDRAACSQQVEDFIRTFGKRAFRRPLSEEEVTLHKSLFEEGTALGDTEYSPQAGVELVVQAMLQSPHFLYRVEFGRPETVMEDDIVELTSYEVASRLSYLLWNTMPDDELFEAADADELRTPEQIEAQARRMLATPRAREAVKNFHRQWLRLDEIETLIRANGKNIEIYPEYRESLLPLWRQETEEFFDYAIFQEDASVDTLFTAPYTMMNSSLAEFYGVSNGPQGNEFVKVELDPTKYSGFLTHPGLMALYAKPDRSSPIHRGKWVRESLLCQVPPAPPDNVPEPPTVDPTQTTRSQFEEHSSNPACSGCHSLMDPIGFGFEHFDGLGRYRETEWGLPINAQGEILGTLASNGPFNGVVELGQKLAGSDQVRRCVSTQWFRFAYGRVESTEEDSCSMELIRTRFAESNYDIKELIVALTQTDAFRYRRLVSGEEMQ